MGYFYKKLSFKIEQKNVQHFVIFLEWV